MRYLSISEYGSFLGLSSNCLVVKQSGEVVKEIALSRLRSIAILKPGITLSSDLIQACATRGIKVFFLDWRNRVYSAVIGQNQHAIANLRKSQFNCIDNSEKSCLISKSLILSKVKNQRAVLMYFGKYLSKSEELQNFNLIRDTSEKLEKILQRIKDLNFKNPDWKNSLLGFEGSAARLYWDTLVNAKLFPSDFIGREGKNANTMTNKALNYGYAILLSFVWSALDNAGLEVYAGFLHVDRPGKPSLVLDCMEEYRAWVVDRNIIKLREKIANAKSFDAKLKKLISDSIYKTMQRKYLHNKKKVKLENILQRQVYKLSGFISCGGRYKGYIFKW